MFTFISSVSIAIIVSFLCSMMEAALLSLSPSQLARIQTLHPRIGKIWQGFKDRIDQPLTVILLLNTAANTIGAMIAGASFEEVFGKQWIVAFSLLFTYVILQFSEILPKSIGVRYNVPVAVWMAYPVRWLSCILGPVIRLIQLINRPFQSQKRNEGPDTLDEISALAGVARHTNQLDSQQEKIIHEAAFLDEEPIEDIMIPVTAITFLSSNMTLAEALTAAHLDPHTRFPVCEDWNKDRILGYINFKELVYHMHTNPNDPSLTGIIRPAFLASPKQSANDLLKIFVDRHEHIALVRSENGDTLGMVTMEDLIEQMLGKELGDEFDKPPTMLHALAGSLWMIGGGVPMARVIRRLQTPLSCQDPEGTIFSDWLISQFGKEPSAGDVILIGDFNFTVRRVRRGKVFEASVSRVSPNSSAQ